MKPPKLSKILETVLYVDDPVAAERYYREVLGLSGKGRSFVVGEGRLLLFDASKSIKQKSPPPHGATGPGHLAFEVSQKAFDRWKKYLAGRKVKIVEEVLWKKPNFRSLYFHDPSGNVLEIATPGIWRKIK